MQLFRKPILSPGQYLKILDETTDYCGFTKGDISGIFWRVIDAIIRNGAKLPHGCPFKVVKRHCFGLDFK